MLRKKMMWITPSVLQKNRAAELDKSLNNLTLFDGGKRKVTTSQSGTCLRAKYCTDINHETITVEISMTAVWSSSLKYKER